MRTLRLYSSTDHRTGSPTASKVWLNATRWPCSSVSASTPSQSSMSADVTIGRSPGPADAAEPAHVLGGHLHHVGPHGGEQRRRVPAVPLPRALQEREVGLHVDDLEGGGDVHLGAAPGDQVGELRVGHPGAAVQGDRDRLGRHDVGHPLRVQLGLRPVDTVRVADRGREHVDPGRPDEVERDRQRLPVRLLVGADAVLDAGDRLDLAPDVGPDRPRLGHDVDRQPLVLRHRQPRAVEQDRVPALAQAVADERAVRAVVEVQGDRDLDARRHRPPHGEQQVDADGPHRLDRGLDDDRGALLDGRRQHRLHGQVVDHVDGGDAVALGERPIDDLLQWHDRHALTLLVSVVMISNLGGPPTARISGNPRFRLRASPTTTTPPRQRPYLTPRTRFACAASSVRFLAPVLRSTAPACFSTVLTDRTSRSAMTLSGSPSSISPRTWRSRLVSGSCPASRSPRCSLSSTWPDSTAWPRPAATTARASSGPSAPRSTQPRAPALIAAATSASSPASHRPTTARPGKAASSIAATAGRPRSASTTSGSSSRQAASASSVEAASPTTSNAGSPADSSRATPAPH